MCSVFTHSTVNQQGKNDDLTALCCTLLLFVYYIHHKPLFVLRTAYNQYFTHVSYYTTTVMLNMKQYTTIYTEVKNNSINSNVLIENKSKLMCNSGGEVCVMYV